MWIKSGSICTGTEKSVTNPWRIPIPQYLWSDSANCFAPSRTPREYRTGPVSTTRTDPALFILNLRFVYESCSLLQHPGIEITREREECDSAVRGRHSPFLKRGPTSEVCQSRNTVPSIHVLLQRHVNQDSPTTSRLLPPLEPFDGCWSFLATLVTSAMFYFIQAGELQVD